jgi:aspartate 1-decarboxylase
MTDSKTLRHVLLGKIHRAVVTRADIDYVGSISIDETLIEAAGFLPNEKVDIYDVTNGSRLATYVIAAERGSGEIGINGAAAHLVRPGDLVIIAAYGYMKEKQARRHVPSVVFVDERNRPTHVAGQELNPPQRPFDDAAPTPPMPQPKRAKKPAPTPPVVVKSAKKTPALPTKPVAKKKPSARK